MKQTVQIQPQWRITIPEPIRERLSAREGDYLTVEILNGVLVLKPVKRTKLKGNSQPASNLDAMTGVFAIGGNAAEDTEKLWE